MTPNGRTRQSHDPPAQPHNTTEYRLSDVATGERGDPEIGIVFLLGALALAVGTARCLAGICFGSGDGLAPDVIGFLRHSGLAKQDEIAAFYGALFLAPVAVWLARSVIAKLGALCWTDPAAIPIALGGGVAIGSVAYAFVHGSRSAIACGIVPGISLAMGMLLAIAARRWIGGRSIAVAHGSVGELGWVTCALTVVLLAVAPRVDRDLRMELVVIRALVVFVGAAIACFGFADLFGIDRAARSLAFVAWLAPIRLAPSSPAWVASCCAIAWIAAGVARRRTFAFTGPTGARTGSAPLFVTMLVFAFTFDPDPNGTIDLFHAGEWLTPASEMLAGATPYRDVYLQHGLIVNALRAFWTFHAFGTTLAADRFANAILAAATHAAFAWMLCGLVRSRLLAAAIAILLASPALWLNVRLLPLFAVVGWLAIHVRAAPSDAGIPAARPGRAAPVMCGAWAGVALAFSLDTGLYALAIPIAFLAVDRVGNPRGSWRGRFASLGWFAVGVLLAVAPFAAWLAARGALGACIENCREQLRLYTSVWGLPHPSFSEVLSELRDSPSTALAGGAPTSVVAAVTWIVLAAFLAVRASTHALDRGSRLLLLVTIAGAVTYRSALGRSDSGHFGYGTAMLWAALAMIGEAALSPDRDRASPALPRIVRIAPFAALLAWWIAAGTPLYGAARHCRALSIEPQHHAGNGFSSVPVARMRGVLVPDGQAKAIASLDAFLNERLAPNQTFFDYSDAGALWFLLDRRCPSRYVQAAYAATEAMQRRLIDDLERTRPPVMIVSSVLGSPELDGIRLDERQPLVKRYLERRYRYVGDFAFGLVFERVAGS